MCPRWFYATAGIVAYMYAHQQRNPIKPYKGDYQKLWVSYIYTHHSTRLQCTTSDIFQSLSALISGSNRVSTKQGFEFRELNPDQGQKVTKQFQSLNWYLVPFFVVHRICVPYGMWGLKTHRVIQAEKTIVYLTEIWGKRTEQFSDVGQVVCITIISHLKF